MAKDKSYIKKIGDGAARDYAAPNVLDHKRSLEYKNYQVKSGRMCWSCKQRKPMAGFTLQGRRQICSDCKVKFMKVTFSRNHDGDALVLIDGKVAAIAKDCEGFNELIKPNKVSDDTVVSSIISDMADSIIADYKEHYDFPPQGESHMHDCICSVLEGVEDEMAEEIMHEVADELGEGEVSVSEIGDYGAVDSREMATVCFNDRKVAECYTNEDAKLIGLALETLLAVMDEDEEQLPSM